MPRKLEIVAISAILGLTGIAWTMSQTMENDAFSSHWMVREDGFLECMTALALFAAALLCWLRGWTLWNNKSRLFSICCFFYGAVLFFGMGEEISWGQRIFDIETPEAWAEVNYQAETNLHNLVIADVNINRLIFGKVLAIGLVVYLLVMPAMYRKYDAVRSSLDKLAIPIPTASLIIAILAVVLLVETSPATKKGEMSEFAICWLMFLVFYSPANGGNFKRTLKEESVAEGLNQQIRRAA